MEFTKTDALIIIDPQNDFCPGGALAVNEGNEVMKAINALAMLAHQQGGTVVVTQDWHPSDHKSFARTWYMEPFSKIDMPYGEQTLWPNHCVQGSDGAAFHPDVTGAVEIASLIIRKGMNPEVDSYSAFRENDRSMTGLEGYLKERGIKRIVLVGLAYDFCVAFSAMDGAAAGFDTIVVKDLTRSIAMPEGDSDTATIATRDMQTVGIKIKNNFNEAVAA